VGQTLGALVPELGIHHRRVDAFLEVQLALARQVFLLDHFAFFIDAEELAVGVGVVLKGPLVDRIAQDGGQGPGLPQLAGRAGHLPRVQVGCDGVEAHPVREGLEDVADDLDLGLVTLNEPALAVQLPSVGRG